MTLRLMDHKVLSFDCYGTLIDWETGIWDALQPLIAGYGLDRLGRERALAQFGRCEMALQAAHPRARYDDILRRTHAAMANELGVTSDSMLDREFGDSIARWPAFADTAPALRQLKKTFSLVILSNVHRRGFEASNRKLGVDFDAVYTAEDIGSYKPDGNNFRYLLEHVRRDFSCDKSQLLHTAQSLVHDHVPANEFGLANVWIDRQRLDQGGSTGAIQVGQERPRCRFVFHSLSEMAAAVANEQAGIPAG